MTEPIRILQWGMLGGFGGVEAFIMNVYRNMDRSKVQFDFLESHDEGKLAYEDVQGHSSVRSQVALRR